MIEVTTKSGFACEIDEDILNDAEALRLLTKTTSKNPLKALDASFSFAEKLLGEEQLSSLEEHLRDEKGKVPMDKLSKEVGEIMLSLGEKGKN